MRIEKMTKALKSRQSDAWFYLVSQCGTARFIQHPARHRAMRVVWQNDQNAVRRNLTATSNNLNLAAEERVIAVVDPSRRRRNVSSA